MHSKFNKPFKPGICTKIFGGTGLSAGFIFGMLCHTSNVEHVHVYMTKPQVLSLALIYCSIGSTIGMASDYTGYKLKQFFSPLQDNSNKKIDDDVMAILPPNTNRP